MHIVILCGGYSTRSEGDYPKPMNLVNGVPMIFYVIESLKVNKLHIVYNNILNKYAFREYLIDTFTSIKFTFFEITFQTRGPVETIYIYLKQLNDRNEQLLFLDNDNVYVDFTLINLPKENFIIYNKNPTELQHYSFVKLENEDVIDIQERTSVSDCICIGGYSFKSAEICNEFCKKVLDNSTTEPYISHVFYEMIKEKQVIKSYYLPESFSLGTPNDIILNSSKIMKTKLRIVFDSEHVTDTAKQIIKKLKSHGHTIIIISDNPDKLDFEYDEIYNKQSHDIYISNKSFNYHDSNLIRKMGFYDIDIKSEFKTNKYNNITKLNNQMILKTSNDLSGELYYYNTISSYEISKIFPRLISNDSINSMTIEYINGTPVSKLYIEGLLNENLFINLLKTITRLHEFSIQDDVIITRDDIRQHYIEKFEKRSEHTDNFPFKEKLKDVHDKIRKNIEDFLEEDYPINNIIHGDLWFSNIMIFKNEYKFYDTRGKFGNKLSIKGHIFYDYAKIYQSILGLDSIIEYGQYINYEILKNTELIFWEYLKSNCKITEKDIMHIKHLTGYLIYGTFYFYDSTFENFKKEMIWNLVIKCL